jgi:hypothetical protein
LSKAPPLLPSETLRRVLRTARMNGTVTLAIAGTFALISASDHDFTGTGIGLAIAAAGAMELHGLTVINHRDERGVSWLIWSQVLLMALVLGYAYFKISHPPLDELKASFNTLYTPEKLAELKAAEDQLGLTHDQALKLLNTFSWALIASITLIYQGGMMLYYNRRRGAVTEALKVEE